MALGERCANHVRKTFILAVATQRTGCEHNCILCNYISLSVVLVKSQKILAPVITHQLPWWRGS